MSLESFNPNTQSQKIEKILSKEEISNLFVHLLKKHESGEELEMQQKSARVIGGEELAQAMKNLIIFNFAVLDLIKHPGFPSQYKHELSRYANDTSLPDNPRWRISIDNTLNILDKVLTTDAANSLREFSDKIFKPFEEFYKENFADSPSSQPYDMWRTGDMKQSPAQSNQTELHHGNNPSSSLTTNDNKKLKS